MTYSMERQRANPSAWRVGSGVVLQGGLFLLFSFLGSLAWLTGWLLLGNPEGALRYMVLYNGVLMALTAWGSVTLALRWAFGWTWHEIGWRGWRFPEIMLGFAASAFVWLVIIGLLFLGGEVTWQPAPFRWPMFMAEWGSLFLGAWGEEVIFRGFWYSALAARFSSPVALGVSSLVFTLLHGANPGWTWNAATGVFLAGVVLALLRERTHGLAWPIGFHWGWNVMQGLVFGLPVSGLPLHGPWRAEVQGPSWWTGGMFGPESGAAAWLALVCFGLLVWRYLHRNHPREESA